MCCRVVGWTETALSATGRRRAEKGPCSTRQGYAISPIRASFQCVCNSAMYESVLALSGEPIAGHFLGSRRAHRCAAARMVATRRKASNATRAALTPVLVAHNATRAAVLAMSVGVELPAWRLVSTVDTRRDARRM